MRTTSSALAYASASLAIILVPAFLTTARADAPETAFQQTLLNLEALRAATPFQDNNGNTPPRSEYSGPLFRLSHSWPNRPLPKLVDAPWRAAIRNGTINPQNAAAYAEALKEAVAENGRSLMTHYEAWDAAKAGWFNEPWLGSLREAIHGTYMASEFGPGIFPNTGLKATFRTSVLTYYDERAAYSLYKVWGQNATWPNVVRDSTQFEEGSIVVKAAVFWSTDKTQPTGWWDAMKGAQLWNIYTGVAPQSTSPQPPPQVWPGYVAQFDIIVKDSQSAPKTGWVFTTLVYDSSAPGDVWDKMVPLGAQWGNDPQATKEGAPLLENWINPKAPKYAVQTLGWGGRLSGPNDGARNDIAVQGIIHKNAPDSGCISCHSTAQWNVNLHKMDTFLLPSFSPEAQEKTPFLACGANGYPQVGGPYICSPPPASIAWMKWFQDRLGTQPMDLDSVATDFDEVLSFKSLPLWWARTGLQSGSSTPTLTAPGISTQFNQYSGAPLVQGGALESNGKN